MKTVLVGCLTCLLVLAGTLAQAQLVNYDKFTTAPLDEEKWVPNGISSGVLDVRREAVGKRGRLKLRAYAGTTTNDGRQTAGNQLRFPEAIGALITRIRMKAEIKTAKQIACAANSSPGSGRLLVPRVGGLWFNDGTCTTPGGCLQPNGAPNLLGDMFASIEVRQQSDLPDGAKIFRIVAQLFLCDDPDCINGITLLFDDTTLGTIKVPGGIIKKVTLDIEWDEPNNQFIYRRDDRPPLFFSYDPALNVGPASLFGKRIEAQGRVQNCDLVANPQERPMAKADVRIRKVRINASALP